MVELIVNRSKEEGQAWDGKLLSRTNLGKKTLRTRCTKRLKRMMYGLSKRDNDSVKDQHNYPYCPS